MLGCPVMLRRLALITRLTAATLTCSLAQAAPAAAPGATVPAAPAAPTTPLGSALAAAESSDYARAETELSAIGGADRPVAQLALGRARFEQGKYAEAEKAAQAAANSPATKGGSIALRAEILLATGKVAEATRLLEGARAITGPSARRIALLLGEAKIRSGHRADAEAPLMSIVQAYNDDTIGSQDADGLSLVGRAAHLLRSPKDANTAFNESERAGGKKPETLAWRADLYLEKYDPGHAEEVLRDALAVAPHRADLLVRMARVKLEQALDFDAADKLIADALAVNPRSTAAQAVKASIALHDMNLTASDAALDAGLANDPRDLELLSLKAATRFLADDKPGYEAAKRKVFAENGEFSRFYGIVGELAEWEHRYDDIVQMMKEAVKIDGEDGKAWADLGLTEMRSGDETAGLEALHHAWSQDHFNVRVFNTLNLYEQTIPSHYQTDTDGLFKIRYPKDEEPILKRYVPRLLGEAFGSMKQRYGFTPSSPVQVELYANREQFSVRTSGLPNIGIQGVCFGHVVAAMAPESEPFNWGNVVWHELGHVFAIQLSRYHVPRWFTEGLSEYETIARRPEWRRELDPELYLAIKNDKLPGAIDMNRAFTHASDANDVTVAYYAASQMMVFTVETFGMPRVVEALKAWGQGLTTAQVIPKAFGLSAADYDAHYRTWQLAKLSRYNGQFLFADQPPKLDLAKAKAQLLPNDASAHQEYAYALLANRQGKEAKAELDQALKLNPQLPAAHYLAAKLAEGDGDTKGADAHLVAMRAAHADGYQVEELAAQLATRLKNKPAAKAAWEAAANFDPTQAEAFRALAELSDDEHKDAETIGYLQKTAMLDQHDRKIWRTLLERLVAAKRWDEARSIGEAAMYVDVESAPVHVAYGRALAAVNQHDKALYEAESATLCKANAKDGSAAQAFFASELQIAHNVGEAKKHRDEALRLDPTNADAKALKL